MKIKTILLITFILPHPLSHIIASEICDKKCEERKNIFIEKQLNPMINMVGNLAGISLTKIKTLLEQPLKKKLEIYYMLAAFFAIFYGIEDESIFVPLDLKQTEIAQLEKIKQNFANIYNRLTTKEPTAFLFYSWFPVGTRKEKTAQFYFNNTTTIPWTINFLPSNTQQTIKKGKSSIKTDQPYFQIYTNEKKSLQKAGTWFPLQRSFNGETYILGKEKDKNVLKDESIKADIHAQNPILINNQNTL